MRFNKGKYFIVRKIMAERIGVAFFLDHISNKEKPVTGKNWLTS